MSVTPCSDSHTTSADSPVASHLRPGLKLSSSSSPNSHSTTATTAMEDSITPTTTTTTPSEVASSGEKVSLNTNALPSSSAIVHPDYPEAKTLLISSKRPKSFLERTARELLAGGTEVIILSALGDAIPLCVQLQSTLEEKKAARHVKVETTYSNQRSSFTAGLRIYMKKHNDFRGSRISPGYVTFCGPPENGKFTPIYDLEPHDRMGSVNAGDSNLFVGGSGNNSAFSEVLSEAGQEVEKYEKLHKALLEKAWADNEEKEKDDEVRAVQLQNLEEYHNDLKLSICRPCKALKDKNELNSTGAVFISAFKETKTPHKKEKNLCMVYVVGPKGSDYSSKADFLSAVHSTAVNLMTALCDFNGLARRQGAQKSIQRLNVCRISHFSSGIYKHSEATKIEVAKAILGGLESGYRHGPAPRLNFAYDDDFFKQAWVESTGLEVYDGQSGDGTSSDDAKE